MAIKSMERKVFNFEKNLNNDQKGDIVKLNRRNRVIKHRNKSLSNKINELTVIIKTFEQYGSDINPELNIELHSHKNKSKSLIMKI